jgi:hypothetical protein
VIASKSCTRRCVISTSLVRLKSNRRHPKSANWARKNQGVGDFRPVPGGQTPRSQTFCSACGQNLQISCVKAVLARCVTRWHGDCF